MHDIPRLEAIDALRGYAVLGVVLVHSSGFVPAESPTLRMLMALGVHGTSLFFLVSAMSLCLSWQARSAHEPRPVLAFYIRRFCRIAPMFYAAMVLYLVLDGMSPRYWAPDGLQWWHVASTALFAHGVHPETINAVVPGGWSVAAEMGFYLILPALLVHLKSTRQAALCFVASLALCAAGVMLVQGVFGPQRPGQTHYLISTFLFRNVLSQLPVFAMGMLLAHLYRRPDTAPGLAILAGVLAIVWGLRALLPPDSGIAQVLSRNLVPGATLAIAAYALARRPVKLLVHPAVCKLGQWSFSIFLLHSAVLEGLTRLGVKASLGTGDLSSVLFFLIASSLAVPLSWASYSAVERPGIAWGRRLIAKLATRAPTAQRDISPG
ncbi:MAG TPA: acyltransferase [Ideonella sp.]|nr:acyltransferase [Ideonella sp.]